MKKVRMTIKTERTFDFEFDESKIDREFIKEWNKHITDITSTPESVTGYITNKVKKTMYPYINLAECIAYAIHVNDADNLEGLEFQDATENEYYTPDVDNDIPVRYKRVGYLEADYELYLDETDLE